MHPLERPADAVGSGDLAVAAATADSERALSTPLSGGPWRLWRSVLLRGAGFPAHEVLRLGSPAFAAGADRLLELEDRAASLRAEALQAVNHALDGLRQDGRWGDKAQRRPLLKAVQVLTAGKLPADAPHPLAAAAVAALREACALLPECRHGTETLIESEGSRLSRELVAIAGSPRFREAVTWQNPHAAATALDALRTATTERRGSQRRQHEQLVASYLQRYCVKNDTIGFFGPVSYAWLTDDGDPVALEQGPGLLESREVYFENWAIDALARRLARAPEIRPWLAPRLKSSYYLEGDTLHRSFGPPARLSAFQARLLAACDGRRTARAIASGLGSPETGPAGPTEAVYTQLERWSNQHVVAWTLEVPFELHPLRSLERALRRVEDPALREPALAAVASLDTARRRVAAAAGNPEALKGAMVELEDTFSALTGAAPHRAHGATYAARGVVYEDCRRDLRLRFGPGALERLGPPLSLVLDGARWLAGELAAAVNEQLAALHRQLCGASGAVDGLPFFSQAIASLLLAAREGRRFSALAADFRSRWARVLGDPASQQRRHLRLTSAEVRERIDRTFGPPRAGWTLSRYASPDLMFCASSVEAFRRGDFIPVLGEIHYGNTLIWSGAVSQHPEPELLRQATGLPLGREPLLFQHALKHNTTQRMTYGVVPLQSYFFAFGDDAAPADGVRILPAGAVVVERSGQRLVARSRDGRLAFDAIDLLGVHLTYEFSDLLKALLPQAPHLPRISLDELVVSRERWALDPATVAGADARQRADRLLGLRRWARALGLPRFCFYKLTTEKKPCFLDLDSPVLLEAFAKMVRGAAQQEGAGHCLTVTEMLPRLDQLWLADRAGNRYTSELRLAAYLP